METMVDSASSSSSDIFQCILSILCRYVADILKLCMKELDVEKMIFDKFTSFLTEKFLDHCMHKNYVC